MFAQKQDAKKIQPLLKSIHKKCPSYSFLEYGLYLFSLFDVFGIQKIDYTAFPIIKREMGFLIDGDELEKLKISKHDFDRRDESIMKKNVDVIVDRSDFLQWLKQNKVSTGGQRRLYRIARMYFGKLAKVYIDYALPKAFLEKAWRAAEKDFQNHRHEYRAKFYCQHDLIG